jgi:toxin ParE1/3/4
MPATLSPRALDDLEQIGCYIEKDSPLAAARFVGDIEKQIQRIGRMPFAYRSRPELGKDLRACPFARYLSVFRVTEDVVEVLRVLHSAMDIGDPQES